MAQQPWGAAPTIPSVPGVPPPPPRKETVRIAFHQQEGLLGLTIINFLLSVVTLGIYSFWGKTAIRQHIWSSIHINEEPVEYTGTGWELFLGALIVGLLILVPLAFIQIFASFLFAASTMFATLVQILVSVFVLFLIGIGTYRARRYRLSRSVWRGIRGSLAGSPVRFGTSFLFRYAMLLPTLGWAYPWLRVGLNRHITNDMRFGQHPFHFRGSAAPLYLPFATVWIAGAVIIALLVGTTWGSVEVDLLFAGDAEDPLEAQKQGLILLGILLIGLPIFFVISGLLWVVYKAAELRYFADCTTFGDLQFQLDATVWSLIILTLGNIFIMLLTLGIGRPFVQRRLIRYVVARLETNGTVDIAAIQQSQRQLDRSGEGLAEAFDIDGF